MFVYTLVDTLVPVEEDVAIHPELRAVLPEIQSRLRCDFLQEDNHTYTDHNGDLTRLYVVFPGQPLAAGWVSYTKEKYTVGSHTICNEKYASYNYDYHTRFTTKRDILIKLVNTYLRRTPTTELSKHMWGVRVKHHDPDTHRQTGYTEYVEARSKFSGAKSAPTKAANDAGYELGLRMGGSSSDELLKELETLGRSGYVFASPTVAEQVAKYVAALDEKKAQENRPNAGDVVFVNYNGIEGRDPDVCRGWMDKYNSLNVFTSADVNLYAGLREDELSRLGALSICQPGQFVADVGMRVNSTCFFIYAGDYV
jgi:hypothetical protein